MREVMDRINPPWQCVFWMPMSEFEAPLPDDGTSFRAISEFIADGEQAMLADRLGASTLSVFLARVRNGCQLCLLLKEQAIAGTLFFVYGRSHRFQHLVLTEQDAVILDARIDPEFRGQGLYPVLLNFSLGTLKRKEVERVFVATSENNEPSLRALRRVGFRYLMRYKTCAGIYKYDVRPF